MITSEITPFGFTFGPMLVERVCEHERGFVLSVRPRNGYSPSVEIIVSPKGRVWRVTTRNVDHVREIVWSSEETPA